MSTGDTTLNCPACRAPLEMSDLTHTCPICGLRMADALDLQAVDLVTGLVTADVTCATCQYNLRTIPLGSKCPECGTAVTQSLTRDELRWANPEWLRSTWRGLGWVVILCAADLVSELYSLTYYWIGAYMPPRFHWLVTLAFICAYLPLTCLASFGITRPEYPDRPLARWGRNRLLRLCAVTSAAACILMWAFPFAEFAWIQGWVRLRAASLSDIYWSVDSSAIYPMMRIAYSCIFLAGVLLLILLLRALARRAGRARLTKALSVVVGLFVIDVIGHAAMMLLPIATAGSPGRYAIWYWYRSGYLLWQANNTAMSLILLVACLRLRGRFWEAMCARSFPPR